ncbi:MAG: hypothetical protein KBC35_01485 [Candidatus Pacebacteria bacterium]|nr:hypothetical protein [Candidatus Paceibacterota bacterium]
MNVTNPVTGETVVLVSLPIPIVDFGDAESLAEELGMQHCPNWVGDVLRESFAPQLRREEVLGAELWRLHLNKEEVLGSSIRSRSHGYALVPVQSEKYGVRIEWLGNMWGIIHCGYPGDLFPDKMWFVYCE